jgi:protein ImuB
MSNVEQGMSNDEVNLGDEEGRRYWLFRLGHYDEEIYQWFLHGFFA